MPPESHPHALSESRQGGRSILEFGISILNAGKTATSLRNEKKTCWAKKKKIASNLLLRNTGGDQETNDLQNLNTTEKYVADPGPLFA